MMVVGDVQDMFMPLLDGFLCTPEESDAVIDSLMEQIPTMFGDTRETEIVLLPAILAGLEALKVIHIGFVTNKRSKIGNKITISFPLKIILLSLFQS